MATDASQMASRAKRHASAVTKDLTQVKANADIPAPDASGAEIWSQASHDLRQPVQALLLLIRALSLQPEDGARKHIIARMEACLGALHSMLETITMIARFEAGHRTPELSPCDAGESTIAAIRALEPLARGRGLLIGATPFQAMVLSDARMLPILLRGLLLAATALNDDGRITVAGRKRGGEVRIEVQFRRAELTPAQINTAFIELRGPGNSGTADELAMGLGFLGRLCSALGNRLEIGRTRDGRQRLLLAMPAAKQPRPRRQSR